MGGCRRRVGGEGADNFSACSRNQYVVGETVKLTYIEQHGERETKREREREEKEISIETEFNSCDEVREERRR